MPNSAPRPHGKSLRKGRYSQPGGIYLITAITRNREPLFNQHACAAACARELQATAAVADILAWVIMPDHIHWLLTIRDLELSRVLQRFKSTSARRINAAANRSGTVWQAGFHDRALRQSDDVKAAARYIIANPLRAGLCDHIGDYPYWNATWL